MGKTTWMVNKLIPLMLRVIVIAVLSPILIANYIVEHI